MYYQFQYCSAKLKYFSAKLDPGVLYSIGLEMRDYPLTETDVVVMASWVIECAILSGSFSFLEGIGARATVLDHGLPLGVFIRQKTAKRNENLRDNIMGKLFKRRSHGFQSKMMILGGVKAFFTHMKSTVNQLRHSTKYTILFKGHCRWAPFVVDESPISECFDFGNAVTCDGIPGDYDPDHELENENDLMGQSFI